MARLVVAKEAPTIAISENAEVTHFIGIDNDVPFAVERDSTALQDVGDIDRANVHRVIVAHRCQGTNLQKTTETPIHSIGRAGTLVGAEGATHPGNRSSTRTVRVRHAGK